MTGNYLRKEWYGPYYYSFLFILQSDKGLITRYGVEKSSIVIVNQMDMMAFKSV
jgi:hypothetical protein